jgi:signal transduction histidine kinase
MHVRDGQTVGRTGVSREVGMKSEELAHVKKWPACTPQQASASHPRLERRKARAEKSALIGALTAGFAHELGTPLGVIRGRAEMLLDGTFGHAELIENLEAIVAQIDHIERIVSLLLKFGRRPPAIRVLIDLRPLVERTIGLQEPTARCHGVTLVVNLGARPLMIDCDPDQLQQALAQLAANALDAMEAEGGILRVNSVADEGRGEIRLSFEDTGPGVPVAIRQRIFEPFFTTKSPGLRGMGLALSRAITSEHDGELALEPRAKGACFVVTLPLARPRPPAADR